MKTRIHKYIGPVVLAGTLLLTGCSKFLQESDPSNFTIDTYFTKPEHARSAVNSIYASMRDPMESGFNGAAWTMREFATGLANTDLGQAVNSYFVKDLINTSDNDYGNTYWTSYYRGIANANLAIEKIPGINMEEKERRRLLGEARFMRAWYYFQLVRMFGPIPLILKPVTLDSPDLRPSQASVEAVYAAIVADLQEAENAGLGWIDLSGKASLGAVKSLLASVYITMAGYPLQKGAPYYSLAAKKAEEVIDSKQYRLFKTYADLHNPAKKNLEENIFMIQFRTQIIPSNWQVAIIPYNKNISAYASETGGIYATPEFVQSFEANDLRVKEKEFFYTSYTLETDRTKVVELGGYYIYKHFDEAANSSTGNSDLNWPLIRYADILLLFAEASNEVNGPTAKAYDAVNEIRRRATLPELSGLGKTQLQEAIWRERWFELCYENVTWYDMARLRKAFNVKTRQFENYVGHKFTYGPVVGERELLFPIPTLELKNNPNLKQNKGY
ncbi:RagB/SusD family nutrient uptake outer membrane protein [Chitinophaga nivalis]|uniref:RagB/SusD family nutrient uptake outer membrane protein n=1 Tax=Chitinophaga nivalis TaxID=2991709 RepID=A0ABT3IMU2_9BACT|nr:RagB/SusD family nutrient uptake outer membrane protein [Chitinophaga nivalis]MCW3465082.1 RagB/SusD family nutrient uptake outer membrane protein [Chitinophaga nivalis]MCW3485226.1 RagB/SusD family nutrient uptake outer membrane protein [Chitinophaga nivalis]